ncbi:MAG TPA: alpha/beta hydrolase [Candidatus Binataceae bacterium]|nr:alpha/beta hydrolase [Candidatus Binataceae bacterium]
MSEPASHQFDGSPRLHYLEWNPRGRDTVILLHGNAANAWWWSPMAEAASPTLRLVALDQRGHGDSEWVRPAAYGPTAYAADLARFVERITADTGQRPVVVGHSMGGISTLAFASAHPAGARAIAAIDIAIRSSRGRDRYLRRLRALPTVFYPDFETAKARYRLMPDEGEIPAATLGQIAAKSLARTEDGRFTLKFDRESFFGSDGLEVLAAIREIAVPLLLVRAERSRIMTAEAAELALQSNPLATLVTIADAHHHVLLERPVELAQTIEQFVASL